MLLIFTNTNIYNAIGPCLLKAVDPCKILRMVICRSKPYLTKLCLNIVASTQYDLSPKDSLKPLEGCSRPGCLTECYMQTQTYYTNYLYILLHLQSIM